MELIKADIYYDPSSSDPILKGILIHLTVADSWYWSGLIYFHPEVIAQASAFEGRLFLRFYDGRGGEITIRKTRKNEDQAMVIEFEGAGRLQDLSGTGPALKQTTDT